MADQTHSESHCIMLVQADMERTTAAPENPRFRLLEDIAREMSGSVIFPTTFDLVVRLRKVLEDPNVSLDRIAEILNLEPLIAVRLVGLANSAAYRRRGPEARDLKTAIQRLGLRSVRSAALAIALGQLIRSKDMAEFKDLAHQWWVHSVRCAAAAGVVAGRMTRVNPDEAILVGLVHDLGAFFLLYRAARYPEFHGRVDTVRDLVAQWHESIGHSLLVALGMPEDMAEAVREHDQPRPAPETPQSLADVLYVANVLAGGMVEWLNVGDTPEALAPYLLPASYQELRPEIDDQERELLSVLG